MNSLFVPALVPAVVGPMRPASGPDKSALADFLLTHPCPATDKFDGACPGWTVDLIVPACAGGKDRVATLHWQSTDPEKLRQRAVQWPCIKRP